MDPNARFATARAAVVSNESEPTFKVLVADDSAIYRKLVEHTLCSEQYEVFYARNGAEAIDLLSKHEPSLVITDWMMPDLNGLELCEHIRSHPQVSYTYIIILTGVTEKNKVVKGLEAGADDYLTKPFHSDELLARVGVGQRIVRLHRQIEANSRQLEELALTDALTGLPNRRAVEEWAPRQLSGAIRHGFSFWVVMADLDLFKSVNDGNGHEAGDAVLKKFSQILKANSRASDMCGRIGGEEFLIVLSHTNEEGARLVVERMREQMEAQRFQFGAKEVVVTASFGIAEYRCNQEQTFPGLVAQADAAMYSAKQRGRNRVEVAVRLG
jgi:two-component system, cell cycle response regulator